MHPQQPNEKLSSRKVTETYHLTLQDVLAKFGIDTAKASTVSGFLPQHSSKLIVTVLTEETYHHG